MQPPVERISELGPDRRIELFERGTRLEAVTDSVGTIVDRVHEEGDVALREYAREFDEVDVGRLEVTDRAERAIDSLDPDIRDALETAIENVRRFHERQARADWELETDGRSLGRRFHPLERVGVYVPGGSAEYPSSAIMGVIPARVAGVDDVVVATPPGDPPAEATLAAAALAGADAVYHVGGAQAIAALAYGTESIPRVQKIVGPGNRWVSAAKAAVRGDVEIDFVAGPSEVLVLADDTAPPDLVAAELLAQAEHDPNACAVVVADDRGVLEAVQSAIQRQVVDRDRREIIETALESSASGLFLSRSQSEAVLFADSYAPEHLVIMTRDPEAILERVTTAGSVFLGPYTPVAAGDYASGPNHVLPTGGRARVSGGLSVDDFLRSVTVQRFTAEGLAELAPTIETLAELEGLEAHAAAVRRRREADDE